MNYERKSNWTLGENKANQSQFPSRNAKNTLSTCLRLSAARTFGEYEGLGWVMASGDIGLTNVIVPVNNAGGAEYLVRLYFAEPENAEVGQRVFNVSIQGRQALNSFDIAQHAGSDGSGIVREFGPIKATASLTLTFTPSVGQPVICGIEVLALSSP